MKSGNVLWSLCFFKFLSHQSIFFSTFFVKCCKWFFCNTFEKKVPNIFSVQLKVLLVETMNLLMWYKINKYFIFFCWIAVYICIIRIPRICSKKNTFGKLIDNILFYFFLPEKPFLWTKIRINTVNSKYNTWIKNSENKTYFKFFLKSDYIFWFL